MLIASDGLIVLTPLNSTQTLYTEYDFFDAKWGVAASFGGDKLWKDTVEGIALSDLAFKVAAERPELRIEQIKDEAKKALPAALVKTCTDQKIPFKPE